METEHASLENLNKMENHLSGLQNQRQKLGRQLKKAEMRVLGAKNKVAASENQYMHENEREVLHTLVRRFQFDLLRINEQLEEVRAKEAWARRTVESIRHALCTNEEGDLIHKPFLKLAALKLK